MRRRDSTGRASGLARATRSGMDGPGTWRAGALTADRCGCRGPQRRAKLDFPHFARSGSHSLWWDLSVRRDYAGVGPVMGHRKNPPASMRGSDTRDESRRIDPRRRQRSSVVKPRTGSSGRWRVAHAALAVRFANMQCSSRRQCGEPQRAAEAACRFSNRECTWPQRLSAGLPTVSAMNPHGFPRGPRQHDGLAPEPHHTTKLRKLELRRRGEINESVGATR